MPMTHEHVAGGVQVEDGRVRRHGEGEDRADAIRASPIPVFMMVLPLSMASWLGQAVAA
jgi:hypothetical protein